MKLSLVRNLIYAPLTVSYGASVVTVDCIVDTGSAGTALDASELDLDLNRPGAVADMIGIGGKHQVLIQHVESVELDGVVLRDFPIEFGDFSGAFSIRGIIGGDLLRHLGVTIDYFSSELRCHEGSGIVNG